MFEGPIFCSRSFRTETEGRLIAGHAAEWTENAPSLFDGHGRERQSSTATLRTGTPVPLKMAEALTTKGKMLKVGQRFNLEVAAPVSVDGQVVIPAGSPVVGKITDVRNKGMWGKSGRIGARLLYVRMGDRNVRLSGRLDDKGVTGTAGVVGAIAVIPVAGFFMTGTSAQIPLGAPVSGVVDEDIALPVSAAK